MNDVVVQLMEFPGLPVFFDIVLGAVRDACMEMGCMAHLDGAVLIAPGWK